MTTVVDILKIAKVSFIGHLLGRMIATLILSEIQTELFLLLVERAPWQAQTVGKVQSPHRFLGLFFSKEYGAL